MSFQTPLPGGHTAQIKDPEELSNRDRKLLRRRSLGLRETRDRLLAAGVKPGQKPEDLDDDVAAKVTDSLDADDLDGINDLQAAFIVAYTASWSLDQPLPTLDTVDDLPGPIFDALAEATSQFATAGEDGSLNTSPDGALDPASPTGPSPA